MNGLHLKTARLGAACTQAQAAQKLSVTQAYLSMVERGNRPVSKELARRTAEVFAVPATALPLTNGETGSHDDTFIASALGALGYRGFSHLRGGAKTNPADLLMDALDRDNLDSRITEALPWLPVAYPKLDWDWLTQRARLQNRQNRVAFVVALAGQTARKNGKASLAAALAEQVGKLEPSRLAAEGTLCRESMTHAEREWLRGHRSVAAEHWNLLTDLTVDQIERGHDHGVL